MMKNKFAVKSVKNMDVSVSAEDMSIESMNLPLMKPIEKPTKMNPECIRTTENWTSIKRHHRFDKPGFNPKRFVTDMKTMSPKLNTLIENIRRLDENDLKKHGKYFKHFIFSDVKKGGYGAKIIASGLIASGFTHCFTKVLDVKTPERNEKNETFGLLSSTTIYDKIFTKKHIKAVTTMFNTRPDNVFGENMRFIVLDSGFKEGIDLFDVKYVHIFENQKSGADLTQAVGRATRTCGQKGLEFVKNTGWKLHVFQYYIVHADSTLWFDYYMYHDGNDPSKLKVISNIEKLMIVTAVDHDLNQAINQYVPVELKVNESVSSSSSFNNGQQIMPIAFKETRDGEMQLVPYEISANQDKLIPIGYEIQGGKSKNSKEIVPLGYKFSPDGSKQIVPLGYKFSPDESKQIVPHGYKFSPDGSKQMVPFGYKFSGSNYGKLVPYVFSFDSANENKQIVPYGYEYSVNGKKQLKLIGYEYVSQYGKGTIQKTDYSAPSYKSKNISFTEMRNKLIDSDIIDEMSFEEFTLYINSIYDQYKYKPITIENLCTQKAMDASKKDERIIEFSESQNFVTHYFVPNHFAKGLLVWHSVGTGKTCTAVSVKSFLFEKSDYTVIWVTRTTLKGDIWKNMYEQICDHLIREKALQGVHEDDFRKYMSKRFLPPLSYKQFSNVLEKKNVSMYDRLIALNGDDDILRNTLIIVDEAHKLYGKDLSGNEKPNMKVIEHHIQKSKSCKVLLMTGTPIINDPMEFSKLMNLIIKKESQRFPTNEKDFKKRFLNGTEFTNDGIKLFKNNLKGLISHLDKRFDPRQFAQPVFHKVPVQNSMYPGLKTGDCISKAEQDFKNCVKNVKLNEDTLMEDPPYADEIYSYETQIEKLKVDKNQFKRSDPKTIELNEKIQKLKDKIKELKVLLKQSKKNIKDSEKNRETQTKVCDKVFKKDVSNCKKTNESQKDMYQNIAFTTSCISKKRTKRI